MAMAGKLEVTPPELQFAVKVGDYSKRQMRLNNLGTQPIAYKIKTTNPKQYFVRPNQGVVQPKERAIIQVMMGKLDQKPTDKCKDKFLVQSIVYEGELPKGPSGDERFDWRREITDKMPNAVPQECRLRCVYAFNEDDDAGAEATQSGGGATAAPAPPKIDKVLQSASKTPAVAAPAPKHSWSMYLIVAVLFFLVGRFTHHMAIPGLP